MEQFSQGEKLLISLARKKMKHLRSDNPIDPNIKPNESLDQGMKSVSALAS